ncbi:MAG: ECF transporter S component [Christensenellaceae bacterium]
MSVCKTTRSCRLGLRRAFPLAKHLPFTAVPRRCACFHRIVVPCPRRAISIWATCSSFFRWLLGPLYGAPAGLGTMLADIVGGYASYAPATLVIKAVMAVAAYFVSRLLKKAIRREKLDVLPRAVSALVGEALMVLGYFFFEGVLLGMGMCAAPNLLGNALQGVCCSSSR